MHSNWSGDIYGRGLKRQHFITDRGKVVTLSFTTQGRFLDKRVYTFLTSPGNVTRTVFKVQLNHV